MVVAPLVLNRSLSSQCDLLLVLLSATSALVEFELHDSIDLIGLAGFSRERSGSEAAAGTSSSPLITLSPPFPFSPTLYHSL